MNKSFIECDQVGLFLKGPSDIFAYKKDLIDDDLLGFFENCLFELILTILDNICKALGYILNQHMVTLALSSHVQNGDIIFCLDKSFRGEWQPRKGISFVTF